MPEETLESPPEIIRPRDTWITWCRGRKPIQASHKREAQARAALENNYLKGEVALYQLQQGKYVRIEVYTPPDCCECGDNESLSPIYADKKPPYQCRHHCWSCRLKARQKARPG